MAWEGFLFLGDPFCNTAALQKVKPYAASAIGWPDKIPMAFSASLLGGMPSPKGTSSSGITCPRVFSWRGFKPPTRRLTQRSALVPLVAYRVSRAVNTPRNNSEALLEHV